MKLKFEIQTVSHVLRDVNRTMRAAQRMAVSNDIKRGLINRSQPPSPGHIDETRTTKTVDKMQEHAHFLTITALGAHQCSHAHP
ncbi:MAG: hypothetical protein ACP5M1_12690 [Acidiphilium sp.]